MEERVFLKVNAAKRSLRKDVNRGTDREYFNARSKYFVVDRIKMFNVDLLAGSYNWNS